MGAEPRHRTAGVRERVLSRLRATGEVTDPGGLASAVLSRAVGYRGSSVAFAQLLSGMERDGLIEREVRGKRTYLIKVADGAVRRRRPRDMPQAAGQGRDDEAAPEAGGRGEEPGNAAGFDYDELAVRLLAQVVRRISAEPADGQGPGDTPRAARGLPGAGPAPGVDDLALTLVSLERRLAGIQSRQRELSQEAAALREQLATAQRRLAEIRPAADGERLGPGERQVLQRLLSSSLPPARQRSAEAG